MTVTKIGTAYSFYNTTSIQFFNVSVDIFWIKVALPNSALIQILTLYITDKNMIYTEHHVLGIN